MKGVPATIGPFRIERRLGQGGMGTLLLGFDPKLERSVAIKVLTGDDEELRERFSREARAVAKLNHRNIVSIYAVGDHDGQPFIAMEYIDGQTIGEIVRSAEPMEVARRLWMMEEVCGGLAYAHARGIVHRDVKPANVMLANDGAVKILDFGIARSIGAAEMTKAGMLIGTLNYMSPEQVAGYPADHRSDMFAAGAVLYELLSYHQAFPGNLQTGILHKILHGEPTPLQELAPDLDPAIAAIVRRALEKDPASRFADLDTMRREIEGVRRRLEGGTGTDWSSPTAVRSSQVATRLLLAERALQAGDIAGATAQAERALQIDAAHAGARLLIDRIRQMAAEQAAGDDLAEARRYLDAGELTDATVLVERAAAAAPQNPLVEPLREEVARARRVREEAEERQRLIADGLQAARVALTAGRFDDCLRAVAEVAALDPGNAEGTRIERDARVQAGLAAGAAAFDAGRLAEADRLSGEVLRLAPEHAEARVLRRRIDEAVGRALVETAAAVRRLVGQRDFDGAESLLAGLSPVTDESRRLQRELAREIRSARAQRPVEPPAPTVILPPTPRPAAARHDAVPRHEPEPTVIDPPAPPVSPPAPPPPVAPPPAPPVTPPAAPPPPARPVTPPPADLRPPVDRKPDVPVVRQAPPVAPPPEVRQTAARTGRGKWAVLAAGLGALVVAGSAYWYLSVPAVPGPQASPVTVNLHPWARVRIEPVAGQPQPALAPAYITPFVVDLLPGRYTLIAENDAMQLSQSIAIEVVAGQPLAVDQALTGFNADELVDRLLTNPPSSRSATGGVN